MAVKISQIKSPNGTNPKQKATLRALGLGRIGKAVEREDSPRVRGRAASMVTASRPPDEPHRSSVEPGLRRLTVATLLRSERPPAASRFESCGRALESGFQRPGKACVLRTAHRVR